MSTRKIQEAIRQACQARGWSVMDLARRSEVSPEAIRRYLAGRGEISTRVVHRLLAALDLDAGKLG